MFGPGTKHLGRAINQRHRAAAEALRAHQLQVERLGQAGEQRHTGPKRHRADHQLKIINQPAGSQCLREKRAAQSPLAQIDRLKAAVMIVHGENDLRTPINQAEALRSALQKRDIPYEWLVKRDEGHGFSDEKNVIELYEKLAVFLEKHIGK